MDTRGLIGFLYGGKYYVCYNHFDSYPSGPGVSIVKQIKHAIANGTIGTWLKQLIAMKIVDVTTPPTNDEIVKLIQYCDIIVSGKTPSDWYCLLRQCQGSFKKILDSGYLINHVNKDGIPEFEEYAYILNFDHPKGSETLDFYEGNKLIESYPITNLPNWEEVWDEYSDDECSDDGTDTISDNLDY